MKDKKVKKKGRKRPEALAKDTLKFAIANGTIKDLLWDNDEQRPHNESESSKEEDLDDHAVEVYNELLLRHVPSVPESELLQKFRQQFIQEHTQPGTKPKHHQTPFPPTQEKGSFFDSPTRSRQTKLVQYHSGNPLFPKQPPVDRSMPKKFAKPCQSISVAEPLPLTQLGGEDNHVERSHPHQHKHHHHDEQFHNHTHVSEDISANLTSSLDLQFRPTSFGNIARSTSSGSESGGRSFKRASGFNLSSKAPEFRTVHEELNIMQDDDVLWGGVLGPNRTSRRTIHQLNKPDERTMAELFDLSHTLRRERELTTGSAAGNIDSSANRKTNWMGGVTTSSYVLPTGKGSDLQKKSFGSGVDVDKQTRKSVAKKSKMPSLPSREPAVPMVNQDFQSFWNEECSYTVSERFKVPGIDTKSNLNTITSAVSTVTEEGTTEPEVVVVDEKEELRNRARELVASLHNFSAIDTKSTNSTNTGSFTASHSKENTRTTATATVTAAAASEVIPDNKLDVNAFSANSAVAKRHSVHVTSVASAAPNPVLTNTTRNTILSTTNSDIISKLFPQLQHHLYRSPDSPAPPTVSVETREAPAPFDDNGAEHTGALSIEQQIPNINNVTGLPSPVDSEVGRINYTDNTNNSDELNSDNEQGLSPDSSMNDSIEYASRDNYTDNIPPGLSLSAESDCDSVSINLSSPRQKDSSDANLSDEPLAKQQSTSKKHDRMMKVHKAADANVRNKSPSPIASISPGRLQAALSNKSISSPVSKSAKSLPVSPNSDVGEVPGVTRVPQVPSTPLTSPDRPRMKTAPRTDNTNTNESAKSYTNTNTTSAAVATSVKHTTLPNSNVGTVYTDTLTASSSVQSINGNRPAKTNDTVQDPTTASVLSYVHSVTLAHSAKIGSHLEINNSAPDENDKNSQPLARLRAEYLPSHPAVPMDNSNVNSPLPYADVDTALLMLNVSNVDPSPIAPPGDLESSIVAMSESADVSELDDLAIADNAHILDGTSLKLTSNIDSPLSTHPTTHVPSTHSHRYNTVNMLPFGLEHLRGIWPYDPSISAYQYMLQLYATRRLNEQKQKERHIQQIRERRKQKQDRQPLHMKHALSETYQVLTFDPEHLNLVLTTHSTSHPTPLHSINVSIQSTYITENPTTNMITLRTTDPAVPSGYLATYSVSQFICMENEINAALAAYELSRVKLQHSNSVVVVVATDHSDENDTIRRTYSIDTDARSNASSLAFSTSVPPAYSLSPPTVPPILSYDDEAEESGVFLTATTGATLSSADHTEQKDQESHQSDADNTDISIRQLRHYAEQGYASFLEMLHAQDPPAPEEPYVIIPSPRRPACFPSSVLSSDTGPVRPLLLPTRQHTLYSHSVVTSSQENTNPGVDDNVAKESNNQNASVAADTAPLVLPSRFGYLIKDALAAVKAAEAERERLRLLELQRRSSVAPMELNTQSIVVPLSDHHKRNFRFYDPHSKHSVYELQNQLGANSSVWYTDSAISATSVPSMSKGYTASGYVVRGESVNITIEGTPLQNTQESSKSGPMSSKTARV